MRKLLLTVLTSILTLSAFAQIDKFAGFYQGPVEGEKVYPLAMQPDAYAEVYRGPNNVYRLKILSAILSRSDEHCVVNDLKADGDKIILKDAGEMKLNGEITPNSLVADGVFRGKKVKLNFKRLDFKSPTLGAPAPAGSIVLFDGKDTSAWELCANKEPCNWEVKDGVMTVKNDAKKPDGKHLNSSIRTKQVFGPFRLHLEFATALDYDKMGQGRSNSGVIMGPYEVQVLDSFGDFGGFDQCGSLYRQTPPQFNACLQPGAWQTYDIVYTPAVMSGDNVIEHAKFTVFQNGIRIHNETSVPFSTSMSAFQAKTKGFKHPTQGISIQLQDHTNPVQFRNIWLQAL